MKIMTDRAVSLAIILQGTHGNQVFILKFEGMVYNFKEGNGYDMEEHSLLFMFVLFCTTIVKITKKLETNKA